MSNLTPSNLDTGISRRAFVGIAGGTAAAALIGMPGDAYGASPASAPASRVTVEQYLGATRSALEELEAHEKDDYYLGTPYGTIGPNEFSPMLADWDCWHPNGKPASNGESYMNCGGFVVAVLEACGADCDIIGTYVDSTGYDFGNKANLSRWRHFFDDHASMRTRYESKKELLASGKLVKGDLILAEPNDWSVSGADNHIMFFWGDSPDEDRAWHSSSKGSGVIAGKVPGNMISRITPKTADCYWLHVPLTNLVEILFNKTSADISVSGKPGDNPAYSLAGATFSIYRSYENGKLSDLITTFTTDKNGQATVDLTPGETVWVNEDKPPKGYVAWDAPKRLTVGSSEDAERLEDAPRTAKVIVVKEDAETGPHAQGWATLEGAVYELEDANGKLHRAETAWSESIGGWAATFQEIPLGKALIREVTPPHGYLLDTSGDGGWHEIELAPDSHESIITIQLETHRETVVRGDIVGGKYKEDDDEEDEGAQSPLAGCVFDIWLQDDGSLASKGYKVEPITDAEGNAVTGKDGALSGVFMGSIESHEDGRFDTRDLLANWNPADHNGLPKPDHALPYGTYTLIEASCPDQSLRLIEPICDIEVRTQAQEVFLMLEDKRITSPVRIRKVDAVSGLPLLKPGTSVELLRKTEDGLFERVEFDAHYPVDEPISTFVIGEDGYVWLPAELGRGTYAIRETAAVPPYLVSEEIVEFIVDEHHDWDEGGIEVTLPNEAATGAIEGKKIDAEDGSGVAGAVYEIRAAHDITMPDGTTALAAGDVAETATTEKDGAWRLEGLPLGDGSAVYEVREVSTPDGYVLDPDVHTVTLEYVDGATAMVEANLTLEEKPTEIVVKKTDAESGEGIEGVEFSIFLMDETAGDEGGEGDNQGNEEDESNKDGEGDHGAESSEPLAIECTDSNGEARFLRLPNDATYLIRETAARADLGYVCGATEATRYLSPEGGWYASKEEYVSSESQSPQDSTAVIELTNDFTKVAVYKADADAWERMRSLASPSQNEERIAAEQGTFLSGGSFRLVSEDGSAVPIRDNEESSWSAAGQQPQMFTHLPVGARFVVQETSAPNGYSAGNDVEFVVEDTTEVQTIVLFNRKIESLPRTFDGRWQIAAGFGIAAAGGAALAAYSKRRAQMENLSRLHLSR